MQTLLLASLILHVTSGFTALITGFLAILAKKGRPAHRLNGKIFFYAMLGVSASAMLMTTVKANQFLFYIALFAFYQNISGYRALQNKDRKATIFDWAITLLGGTVGGFMVTSGNIVLTVFGCISLLLALGDLHIYSRVLRGKSIAKNEWLRQHIGMMLGTYIATFTAFLVVNINFIEPYWIVWLAPTAFGVPYLIYMSRKHAPRHYRVNEIISSN